MSHNPGIDGRGLAVFAWCTCGWNRRKATRGTARNAIAEHMRESEEWRRRLDEIVTAYGVGNERVTLESFLLARITEDEAWITGDGGSGVDHCQECAFGQQPQSPYSRARILAECETKRQILAWKNYEGDDPRFLREYMLRALALPYAAHPDYDAAWTA